MLNCRIFGFMTHGLAAVTVICGVGPALAGQLDEKALTRCMNVVALQTKDVKGLRFNRHKFNCKGVSGWKTTDGVTLIKGRLSHALAGRPDDQVDYSFELDSRGVVSNVRMNIKRGGAGAVVKRFRPPVIVQRGVPLNPDGMNDFFKWTGEVWDGSWESTAQSIVGGITTSFSYARAAAKSGEIGRKPIYHYNIAPRENGPVRIAPGVKKLSACRKACKDSSTCKVWSFQNRRQSDGRKGARHCKLYSEGRYRGFRVLTRSITGRVR